MCTVSFLPLPNNNFILTSNRDESPFRKTIAPEFYIEYNTKLLYPKDELAGGTWIGVSEKNRLVCLLNGGFEKHQRKQSYKTSRGVIVKELLASDNGIQYIEQYDFKDIEPFTIILVEWEPELKVHELVWDGEKKHFYQLPLTPKIWSSSPLYDSKMKKERENWFQNWQDINSNFSKESILEFHHNTDLGTKTTAPVMDRLFVKTVSISCVEKTNNNLSFSYEELNSGKKKEVLF